MHGQVEELVKNYRKIDIMWFDYSFDQYSGEKWKVSKRVEMVRKNQLGIIIDNRLETHEGSSSKQRIIGSIGDLKLRNKVFRMGHLLTNTTIRFHGKPVSHSMENGFTQNWIITGNYLD